MNCIIVDDEIETRTILTQFCSETNMLNLKEEFSNSVEALKYLNNNKVDLIFLDIHLPDLTGFDLIKTLKNPPKIIIVSIDKNKAVEAFEHSCIIDYLAKPLGLSRFIRAVNRAHKTNLNLENKININREGLSEELYLNINKRLIKIFTENICFIKAQGDYVLIKADEKKYTVKTTLINILIKLSAQKFIRVHRSYIVNVNKIEEVRHNFVLIKEDIIPVSLSNKKQLKERLNLL